MEVSSLAAAKANPNIEKFTPGDTVKVSVKIVEGDKERIQVFQGVVIKMQGGGNGASFTVRHVAQGIGVERTFPAFSPFVEKVEVVRHGKVRRAKLYYLRGLSGKEARRKIKRVELIKKQLLTPEEAAALEQQEAEAAAAEAPVPAAEVKPEAAQTEVKAEQTPPTAAPAAPPEQKPEQTA